MDQCFKTVISLAFGLNCDTDINKEAFKSFEMPLSDTLSTLNGRSGDKSLILACSLTHFVTDENLNSAMKSDNNVDDFFTAP